MRFCFEVTGRVQGVGFRAHAQQAAARLGLVGHVQNRADGSVVGEAAGAAEPLRAFAEWLRRGPAFARVDALRWTEIADVGGEVGFTVRR